jgi:predicted metal-dependent hydrolase
MKRSIQQPQSTAVQIEGIGQVLLERSRRAKRINVTVRPFKGVRVAVPYGVSYQDALEVAQSNMAWITKQLQRMRCIEQSAVAFKQPAIINRAVARNVLIERVAILAERYGFGYNKVFVRNQKTRWGSCSTQNNINLNLHIVRLPVALMDYVIVHELLHTRIKHHGPRFWEALEKVLPDSKRLDQELNRYEAMLTGC